MTRRRKRRESGAIRWSPSWGRLRSWGTCATNAATRTRPACWTRKTWGLSPSILPSRRSTLLSMKLGREERGDGEGVTQLSLRPAKCTYLFQVDPQQHRRLSRVREVEFLVADANSGREDQADPASGERELWSVWEQPRSWRGGGGRWGKGDSDLWQDQSEKELGEILGSGKWEQRFFRLVLFRVQLSWKWGYWGVQQLQ